MRGVQRCETEDEAYSPTSQHRVRISSLRLGCVPSRMISMMASLKVTTNDGYLWKIAITLITMAFLASFWKSLYGNSCVTLIA